MYLCHLGFWRNTFPLSHYKSALSPPQINLSPSSHCVCGLPFTTCQVLNVGGTELSTQIKKKNQKIMDKKWFSEFACYSALKEPSPTPAQRPWEEHAIWCTGLHLEIMCQIHQKRASFLTHQSLLELEGTLQNQVESSLQLIHGRKESLWFKIGRDHPGVRVMLD